MKPKTILILAILLRVLLMPFFYHPDTKSQYFHFQFLSRGHLNIYQYIDTFQHQLPYRDTFNYLPLTYFTFGTINAILEPIMPPDFNRWINNWGIDKHQNNNLSIFLFFLKIPYLILDLLTAFILYKITKSKQVLTIWLFNPLSLYLIYVLGNFDILPTFITLLSLYFLNTRPQLSFFIFGFAIALKLYPLIFLPIFIFSVTKNISKIINYGFLALTPLILTVLPFVNSIPFWQSFFGSGLTQKIIEFKIMSIPVFPLIYLIILIRLVFLKSINISKEIFYIFLLFIATVNFHPQWVLWFLPFIFLLNDFNTTKFKVAFEILSILILINIFLFNDNYLTWGHLIPIDPEFILLPTPYDLFRYRFLVNPEIIQTAVKNCLTLYAILFFLIYEKNNHRHHL